MNTDCEQKTFFLEINVPAVIGTMPEWGFPAGNTIGFIILMHYLESYFKAEGLADGAIPGAGELNHCFFLFSAKATPEAIAALRSALKKMGLLLFARIYQFDTAELVLRCIMPEGGAPVSLESVPEGFNRCIQHAEDSNNKKIALLTEIIRRLRESGK
jgi:hypothetical protein